MMRILRPALLALAMLLAVSPAARAQGALAPGMRVRVLAPALEPQWIAGTVLAADSGAVRLRVPGAGAAVVVPMRGVQRVQLSRGRGRATGEGSIAGATLGALAGYLLATAGGADVGCVNRCGGAGGGAFLMGAGVGAVFGALLGRQVRSGPERWRDLPVDAL